MSRTPPPLACSILETIGNTPLVELGRLARLLNLPGRLLAKLEYFSPGASKKDRVALEIVRRARADAVVFTPAKFCEPALFDYVLMKQGLERAGIPHLLVEFEEKMWTFERTRNEIETFVESMLFD